MNPIDVIKEIKKRKRIAYSRVIPPSTILLSVHSINENNQIGDVIGMLSSIDLNPTETFAYTLVAGTGDTDNGSFTITSNLLKAGEVFDYDVKNSYSIRIRSTDSGAQTTDKIFVIAINNVTE